MSDERNPLLERFFDEADRNYDGEAFVASVMARANKQRAQRLIVLILASFVAIPAIWLLSAPLNDAVQSLTAFISQPIMAEGTAISILEPLNSIASMLGLGLFGLLAIYRWLFS